MFSPSGSSCAQDLQISCNTSRFLRKDISLAIFLFCFLGDGGGDQLDVEEFHWRSSEWKLPTLECAPKISIVLFAIDGVEIDYNAEGTGDWGLSLSLCCSAFSDKAGIVTRMLEKLAGKLRSVKVGRIVVFCLP